MRLTRLTLTHFRNYRRLELDFSRRFTLLQGRNAQGKTNLLEAIYFLATSKSSHTRTEKEVVGWGAATEPIPYCQITGVVQSEDRETELDIIFTPKEDGEGFRKQVRINGVNKRSMDLLGHLRAVLFLPEDIVLVAGGPSERRHYLDIALCQMDRVYCQHLSRYQKVLTQRNSLLKNLREAGARPGGERTESQLPFWDDKVTVHGGAVIARRQRFIRQLEEIAQPRHAELTEGAERLNLRYLPSFNPGHVDDAIFARLTAEQLDMTDAVPAEPLLSEATVRASYLAKLLSRRSRELAAGTTLYGPHRDDLRFLANGHDLRTYGSRGQQRTAALALKLAEVQAMQDETGEAPLLLLDDVMSELDAHRRATLLTALAGVNQAILTTTDWADFSPEFRAEAQLLAVGDGEIRPGVDQGG
ncbi:MAG: DNA replication/repair protein RecF [Caldilineaceae bacterium]|nr:DNA replication/repair protein RecF [Caldilineaceae bacterium]MBP8108159.1 DNA replication/repair protein RecF [Caldilineaceae bacterium]MBP8123267.1 DNA replication/repair protein RecF [Caldilineaceae bacterium]MBP9072891.1 DNA replication/repair protein RecF [Caldilineaceae bacterium]